jgi:hypothetical protein
MDENKITFIQTDNNKIVNEMAIRWVEKIDECLNICIKSNGCNIYNNKDTHKVCKINNMDSYNRLIKHFQEKN